jgi:hypothetical protein
LFDLSECDFSGGRLIRIDRSKDVVSDVFADGKRELGWNGIGDLSCLISLSPGEGERIGEALNASTLADGKPTDIGYIPFGMAG